VNVEMLDQGSDFRLSPPIFGKSMPDDEKQRSIRRRVLQ
jgi:hypothetical protein